MALINCHECKAQISHAARVCPQCGAKSKLPHPAAKFVAGFFGLIVLFVVWAIFRSGNEDFTQRQKDRLAIEWCQKQVDDELLDLATRRFARDTCTMMRSKFKKDWGINP